MVVVVRVVVRAAVACCTPSLPAVPSALPQRPVLVAPPFHLLLLVLLLPLLLVALLLLLLLLALLLGPRVMAPLLVLLLLSVPLPPPLAPHAARRP